MIRKLAVLGLASLVGVAMISGAVEARRGGGGGGGDRGGGGGASEGSVLFGSQTVGFANDKDTIAVGREIGKFDRVRLRIGKNDVEFKEVRVVYDDGTSTDVPVNERVRADTWTKWYVVKNDHFINEIQMTYQSKPSLKGEATVAVYGEYAEGWLKPSGEGRKYNQGWVLLGSDDAGFIGFDNRTFSIGKNEGGFRNLRVTARNRAITLREVTIVYADGKSETLNMRERVDADQSYGPIDLKGAKPAIKEIKARYRSRFFDTAAKGGAARVEIWGQH